MGGGTLAMKMQFHTILDHYYDHICVMEKLEKLAQITNNTTSNDKTCKTSLGKN